MLACTRAASTVTITQGATWSPSHVDALNLALVVLQADHVSEVRKERGLHTLGWRLPWQGQAAEVFVASIGLVAGRLDPVLARRRELLLDPTLLKDSDDEDEGKKDSAKSAKKDDGKKKDDDMVAVKRPIEDPNTLGGKMSYSHFSFEPK